MSSRGFTLIETMIVVVVAGLVLAMGVPAFAKYRSTLALRQARNQLTQDLRYARQMAVTRRAAVFIRFGNGTSTTDITTYLIHCDTDADRIVDTNEIRSTKKMPKGSWIRRSMLSPVDTLAFDISGILWPGTTGGSLVITNDRSVADTLLVSAAGIIYHP